MSQFNVQLNALLAAFQLKKRFISSLRDGSTMCCCLESRVVARDKLPTLAGIHVALNHYCLVVVGFLSKACTGPVRGSKPLKCALTEVSECYKMRNDSQVNVN